MKTGDTHYYDTYLLLFIVSGILFFVMIKKKKGKQLLSVLLCVTLIGAIVPMGDIMASADQITSTIMVSNVVKVNGKELKHEAKVSYFAPEEDDTELKLNLDNFMYDESSNKYYAFNQVDTLEGRVKNPDDVKKLSYSVKDVNDKVLLSGDLSPKLNAASKGANPIYASGAASGFRSNFTIDKFALIVGENTVKVEVEYKNGDKFSVEVVINNVCEENMTSLNVDMGDDDNDGVLNFIEELYHSDPKNADADKDGLDDYYEMAIFGTDPNKADSNDNGISDADEDMDSDGLSNIDEITKYNTDPLSIDGDGDGLTDYDEVTKYKTDPTNADCDGDGASDGWEVQYGFDPLTSDSDFGEYSLDGDSTVKNDDGSEITIVFDDEFINESTPGYMGSEPIHVELGNNTTTNISIQYDPSTLSGEDAPTIYYFNEDKQVFEEVPTTVSDDGKAMATIDKSGTYVLLNRRYVYDVWENDIIKSTNDEPFKGDLNIAFVMDCSPSMSSNDPNNVRQEVVKKFIERLRENDKASIIMFTSSAKTLVELTDDKKQLIDALENVRTDGGGCGSGTNGSAGLRNAVTELEKSDENAKKYIVFLTDGYDTTVSEPYFENENNDGLVSEIAQKNIIVHTVGLVGTGQVDIDLLKQIAERTNGNYYLATEGTEAENTPESIDIPGLEQVYDDIADQTISRVADSNNDGITDYYTKLMCEGKILTSKGTKVFGDATYEQVQSNADFDGDGLINGTRRDSNTNEIIEKGEIDIITVGTSVYAKIYSYPDNNDSDNDGLGDYEETKVYNTNPLKYNSNVDIADVDYLTNSKNFLSSSYSKFYNDDLFEQLGITIGNAFFGNKLEQTQIYQSQLISFFSIITNQESEAAKLRNNYETVESATDSIVHNYKEALFEYMNGNDTENAVESVDEFFDTIGLVKEFVDPSDKIVSEASKLRIINQVNAGNKYMAGYYMDLMNEYLKNSANFKAPDFWTTERTESYLLGLKQKYWTAMEKNVKLSKKVEVRSTRFSAIATKLDVAMYLVSIGATGVQSYLNYNELMGNLETIKNNISILDTILNSKSSNAYLKDAARNIKYYFSTMYNEDVNTISKCVIYNDYMMPVLETALMEDLHLLIASNPVGAVVEIGRAIGKVVGLDDMCENASKTVASAQIADILSSNYINNLNGGNALKVEESKWVAYADYSEELYNRLLYIIRMRAVAEQAMSDYQPSEKIKNACKQRIVKCIGDDGTGGYLRKYTQKQVMYYIYTR